jgi:phenylpropionate dioxygenase-like ring-hydroxylating dioxygenase large terminal subunit
MDTSAPAIAPEMIEELGRDILEASTLPGECYWREDIYQREIERIFRREWICVGRVEDIPGPGDYMTQTIANEPLMIVRDANGQVRTHLNVCRHRGCPLVEGSGTAKAFRCPYHGWMYGLNGELRGTPDFKATKNFDKKDFPLHSVKTEVWDGFIMVNLDPDATPFAHRISETTRWGLDRYRIGPMVTTHRWEYQLECNWKTYVENYIEAYHVPWVHAETFQPITPLKDWIDYPDISDQPWAVMVGQTPGVSLSDTADALFPISPDLADMPPQYDGMPIWLVYPTFMVIPVVDCMIYYVAHPRGPERCDISLRLCLPAEIAEKFEAGDPATLEAAEQYARNTETFILEDNKVCQLQQVGLRSAGAVPGRYCYHEALARKFDHWVAQTAYLPRPVGHRNGRGNGNGNSARPHP